MRKNKDISNKSVYYGAIVLLIACVIALFLHSVHREQDGI